MFVYAAASTPSASGYGLFLLETVAALALIAVAAWALVRFSARRDLFGKRGTRLKCVERLSLDARRSVHLVQVDDETLLLGVSENGVSLLKSLPAKEKSGNSPSEKGGRGDFESSEGEGAP